MSRAHEKAIDAALKLLGMEYPKAKVEGTESKYQSVGKLKGIQGSSIGGMTVTKANQKTLTDVQDRVMAKLGPLGATVESWELGDALVDMNLTFALDDKNERVLSFRWELKPSVISRDPECPHQTYWYIMSQTTRRKQQAKEADHDQHVHG